MKFSELAETNKARCESRFHEVGSWAPWEWSNAMSGEVGEMCAEGLALMTALSARAGATANLTKKMARVWPANQFKQQMNKPEDQRISELTVKMMHELGDVIIYADLLSTRLGVRLEDCVRLAFNTKSAELGCEQMLSEAGE